MKIIFNYILLHKNENLLNYINLINLSKNKNRNKKYFLSLLN